MSNCELPLTVSVSLQRSSEILGAPNQQNRRRHLMEQALQYAMRSQSASCPPLQQAIVRRSHPHNMAKTALARYRFRAPRRCGYIPCPFGKGEGLVRMWSSPCRRDGEVEKSALRGGYILSLRARERLGEKCGILLGRRN